MLNTWGCRHTLGICNTYCFSVATLVMRMCLCVTCTLPVAGIFNLLAKSKMFSKKSWCFWGNMVSKCSRVRESFWPLKMNTLLPWKIQLLSDIQKNKLFRGTCESQLGESCMLTGICENLQCIFSIFRLMWIKFPTQDVHKTFLSNYVFCENQYSEIPHYPFKVKIVRETAHDAVKWAAIWSIEVLRAAALYFHMLIMSSLWCCS